MGIGGCLFNWLRSYLTDRKLIVKFACSLSSPFSVTSGVPQGSHLGPFLFSIFVNAISEAVKSNFLLFADDVKLFSKISCPEDHLILQSSLTSICQWCDDNAMDLNVLKSCVITFHRTKDPMIFDYSVGDRCLPREDSIKDLGVTFTASLNPSLHIKNICAQANKMLGFIVRSSKDMSSIYSLKYLYIALVRPRLEYASLIWSPYQAGMIDKLEAVQRRFLRLVGVKMGLGYLHAPVKQLEELLQLQPLHVRRTCLDACFLRRVVCGEIDCPALLELITFRVPHRTRSLHIFSEPLASSCYSYGSAIPRLHRVGNTVADQVDFFYQSAAAFKKSTWKKLIQGQLAV